MVENRADVTEPSGSSGSLTSEQRIDGKKFGLKNKKLGDDLSPKKRQGLVGPVAVLVDSAVVFLICALSVMLLPVDFVTWKPGKAFQLTNADGTDVPIVDISNVTTYPVTSNLLLTTVDVTPVNSQISLIGAMGDFFHGQRQVIPLDYSYPPALISFDRQARPEIADDTAQESAIVAALRAADIEVEEIPAISGVVETGPANTRLQVGDLITSIDGVLVGSVEDVRREIRNHQVGDVISVGVIRDNQGMVIEVPALSSSQDAKIPILGINLYTGYRYEPEIVVASGDAGISNVSGLPLALTIYDKLTPGDLFPAIPIAATGKISATGEISAVDGIRERMWSAQESGAKFLLIPEANCADVGDAKHSIKLVKVATLQDAISTATKLAANPLDPEVPLC